MKRPDYAGQHEQRPRDASTVSLLRRARSLPKHVRGATRLFGRNSSRRKPISQPKIEARDGDPPRVSGEMKMKVLGCPVPLPSAITDAQASVAANLKHLKIPSVVGVDDIFDPKAFSHDPATVSQLACDFGGDLITGLAMGAKLGLLVGSLGTFGVAFAVGAGRAVPRATSEVVEKAPRGVREVLLFPEEPSVVIASAAALAGVENCRQAALEGDAVAPIAISSALGATALGVPLAATLSTAQLALGSVKLVKNALTPKEPRRSGGEWVGSRTTGRS